MRNSKFKSFFKYAIVCLLSVLISFAAFYLIFLGSPRYAKLRLIDAYLSSSFYGEFDKNAVDDKIFSAYLSSLGDRYAAYYNAEAAEEKSNSEQGNFMGLGVTVTKYPDTELIYVDEVYENGPAYNAGIKGGDVIVAINGVDISDKKYADSVNSLLGKKDEKITVTISRDSFKTDYELTYAECEIQSVFYNIIENIGYIRITSFNSATVAQFKNAINTITANNDIIGLVFDLRNNGGGTVNSVCEMLDILMPKGTLMTVEYANGKSRTMWESDENEVNLPMAVVTNKSTASAAELFSATIRDFKKGVLVGQTTYGKGVMQQTFPLFDGSAIKFTVAQYFSNSHVSFDGIGLEPDISVELSEEQNKYYYQLSPGEDAQVLAAINWIKSN